jgi:hypothetical protein
LLENLSPEQDALVAVITPSVYYTVGSTKILGDDPALIAANYNKFLVSANGSDAYVITRDGRLKKVD